MRLFVGCLLLVCAPLASANAVMGVGLEQFHPIAWGVYVLAIVGIEAWWIGRRLERRWYVALGTALLANFVTAVLGNQCCGVFLHTSFAGSRLNPIPLLNFIIVLTVFAAISAFVEYVVWRLVVRDYPEGLVFRAVVAAHVIGIFIGVPILLSPDRPYPFLEGYTDYARRLETFHSFKKALFAHVAENDRLPVAGTAEEFVRALQARDSPEDLWTIAYRARYGRFSTTESRRHPYELNPKLSGLKLELERDDWPAQTWLMRHHDRQQCEGFIINWFENSIRRTSECTELGL